MKIKGAVLHRTGAVPPYAASKPLSIETVELDPPGEGEVLVKIGAAGLCHSDLSTINGVRPRPTPMLMGHEAAGIVEELGSGVDDLRKGDHVVLTFVPRLLTFATRSAINQLCCCLLRRRSRCEREIPAIPGVFPPHFLLIASLD